MKRFRANVLGGTVSVKGQMNSTAKVPLMAVDLVVANIDLAKALKPTARFTRKIPLRSMCSPTGNPGAVSDLARSEGMSSHS